MAPQTCGKSNFSFYLVKTSLVLPTTTRQLTSIKSFHIRHGVLIRKWANFQSCRRVKKFHRIDFQGACNQYPKCYENLSPKPSLGSYLKQNFGKILKLPGTLPPNIEYSLFHIGVAHQWPFGPVPPSNLDDLPTPMLVSEALFTIMILSYPS